MTAKHGGTGRADSTMVERSKHIETCHVIVSWPDPIVSGPYPQASTPAHSDSAWQDGGAGGAGGLGGGGQGVSEEEDSGWRGEDHKHSLCAHRHSLHAHSELGSEVFAGCPFEVVEPAATCGGRVVGTIQVRLPCGNKLVGQHDLAALIQWYTHLLNQDAGPGAGITLQFAASLAKEGRAQVHKEAERAGLVTLSRGFGDQRHVCVAAKVSCLTSLTSCHGALGGGADCTKGVRVVGKEAGMLVERICGWCAAEGDSVARFSRSEIHEMVHTNSFHPQIAALKVVPSQ
jgi:hypothetical protein